MMNRSLIEADLEIARLIESELNRQRNTLMLIPSENYASRAVMAASGSVLTNKYAEGYPKRRYYNGCDFYDKIEQLAIDRAKELFGVDHANVQPHTGTQANMAVYWALLNPGDRILSMSLAQGGHLSHGDKVNFSGFYYEPHFYGLDPDTDQLNYDHIREVALEVQPKIIVCGASAYPRTIDFDRFRAIADEVGAYLLADIAHISGLVVAGQHPSPAATADMISTTTHKTLRGPRGALVMCKEEYQKKLDRAVFPGVQAGPLMNIVAAKAVCFKEAMEFGFKEYQRQIVLNAAELAKTLKEHDFNLVTDGTDNHLMLVRLTNKNITGRVAADLMEMAGMVVNKNMVPNDPLSPAETSGIRPGTPGVTTRGMKEKEMQLIGSWIARVIHDGRNADGTPNEAVIADVRSQVEELCDAFPIYPSL